MKRLAIACLVGASLLGACAPNENKSQVQSNQEEKAEDKVKVMTSFHPIHELVKTIGKDRVTADLFVQPGVDAHNFEPSAKDMAALKDSKVLFLNGLGMEHWAEDGAVQKTTKVMVLSDGIDAIPIEAGHEEEGPHAQDDGHDHGSHDPHVWLGIAELKIMAENTATALTMVSPEDKAYFEGNLKAFQQELDNLAKEYVPRFKAHQGKSFVTGHEAFAYLCRNLGLNQKAVEGPFAEGEPTPQKIKELTDHVKADRITTIFVEELASPKVSETLARETGAQLVTIPTLETKGEILPTLREIYEKVLASLEQEKKPQ